MAIPLPAAAAYNWRTLASSYKRSAGPPVPSRPRHALARHGKRLIYRRAQIALAPDFSEKLDVRLDQRALVDVLQRAAALQRGGRGAAEQDDGRLRQLRALERGGGV